MAEVVAADRARTRGVPKRIILMAVLALGVGVAIMAPYLGLNPADSRIDLREGVPFHWPVLLTHILTGGVALLVGPVQFVPAVRRYPRIHRTLGRVYLAAGVLPSGVAGMAAATLSTSGISTQVSMFLASASWLVTGWYAYRAARSRRFGDHREWMIRNYAITFLAVTARIWVPLLILVQLPVLGSRYGGDLAAAAEASIPVGQWASWAVNLIVAEIIIHRTRAQATSVAP